MGRVDLHVKVLDTAVAARAEARGLDAIVYAPHFTRLPDIRERAAAFSSGDLTVIPAREIFTGGWRNRKHVLALDLEEPVPDFITLDAAMEELARQDAVVLAPHPGFATVSLDYADLRAYRGLIDAVEVYNPKHLPSHNRRAHEMAADLSLLPFTSSYAHLRGTVGEAWTTFSGLDAPCGAGAVIEALRDGTPRSVERRRGIGHRLRCTAELAHLLYENTWEKFDRTVLSGMEATHPDHPMYGGRFEDASVY